jgi:hypothetical protein
MMEAAPPAAAADEPQAIRGVSWSARHVGFGILWFLAVFLLPQVPPALFVDDIDNITRNEYMCLLAANAISFVGIALVASRYMLRGTTGSVLRRLGFRAPGWPTLGWGVVALVAALAVLIAYGIVIEVADIDSLRQECDDQIPLDIRRNALLLGLTSFLVAVFAPLAEELFFRGFAFRGLARSWGLPAAIFGSSLLFGLAHLLGNPFLYPSLIPFTMIGAIFAFSYLRSGNLLTTVGVHFVYNLIGVISIAATECNPS